MGPARFFRVASLASVARVPLPAEWDVHCQIDVQQNPRRQAAISI